MEVSRLRSGRLSGKKKLPNNFVAQTSEAVCQCATKLITLATETSLLTIQPRPNIHTPHRLLTSEEDACIFLVFSFNLVPQRDQVPITSTLSLNCISKAVTFHRRNCQRVGIGFPSVGHEICGARRCARLRIGLHQQGRGCQGVPFDISSHALGQAPARSRRGTVSGQLSVPFLFGQHPRRNDAAFGHQSETFHHFF